MSSAPNRLILSQATLKTGKKGMDTFKNYASKVVGEANSYAVTCEGKKKMTTGK